MSDKIICNSNNTRESFSKVERMISRDKTDVIYNGVNVKRVEGEGDWRNLDGKNKMCSVGRMVDQKNYKRFVESIGECREEVEGVTIVGGGGKINEVDNKAREKGVRKVINMRGEVTRKEVYRELYRSDIFVMPSLWEGFCNAVVEAMVAGRVIVCSDIPTLREVVGPCGMYFDPTSVSSIANTLDEALRLRPSERMKRGQASRERAVKKFDMKESAREYVEHYRELARRNN